MNFITYVLLSIKVIHYSNLFSPKAQTLKQHFSNFSSTSLGGNMERFASYLLQQQSFYPLHPPDPSMCIDLELLEQFGMMNITPHILLLPSNFNHFIKVVFYSFVYFYSHLMFIYFQNIAGCVVINPERLTKGYVAGSFARIEIHPCKTNLLCNDIACQVVRI